MLLHITRAPGGAAGAQGELQLRIMGTGKLVQFARARHLVDHVGEIRRAVDRITKRLRLDDEFGKPDLVERPETVCQLHTDLERVVALPRGRCLPFAGARVEAFDRKRLAAGTPGRGHRCKRGFPRHFTFQCHRRNHVEQRIQCHPLLGCGWHQAGVREQLTIQPWLDRASGGLAIVGRRWRRLARRHLA